MDRFSHENSHIDPRGADVGSSGDFVPAERSIPLDARYPVDGALKDDHQNDERSPADGDRPDAGAVRHGDGLLHGDTGCEIFGPAKLADRSRRHGRAGRCVASVQGRMPERCGCAECRAGDALPDRAQGWPGCFQLKLPIAAPRFDKVWFWRVNLGDRKGQKCRIVATGTLNAALIEFDDGYRVVSSRYAVRKPK